MKTPVSVYLRVSTEEQATDGFSIEGQLSDIQDYCARNNMEIVRVYKDEGISGKSMERPDLQRLLAESSEGIFELVIVWNISRLSRKLLDALTIVDMLDKSDVGIFSVKENISARTPNERAMLQVSATFAELHRNQIIEGVKMGMSQRAKEGKWNGGIVLGYESKDKQLFIVPTEAQIVRRIFDLYNNGKGLKAIANQLNHEGYKTKRSRPFGISTVGTILDNPVYAGFVRFNNMQDWSEKRRKGKNTEPMIEKGIHEPIIDLDTWNKTRSLREQKANKPAKTFTGHFPLTTLLRCPSCGHGMIGHHIKKSKGSEEYITYYMCGNYNSKGSAVCKANMVRTDYAEPTVFQRVKEVASNPDLLKSIVDQINSKIVAIKKPLEDQLEYAVEQTKITNANIERLLELCMKPVEKVPKSVTAKINALEEELDSLEQRVAQINIELAKPTVEEVSFDDVQNILKRFAEALPLVDAEKQKALLHSIIDKITVNPSDNINERSIKDIELVFDASPLSPDYVLTCGTVPPAKSETPDKPVPTKSPAPSGVET